MNLVCITLIQDNKNKTEIRKATLLDLDKLMRIYAHARKMMAINHNPHQWKDTDPEKELIISRINQISHYIVENNSHICCGFSLIPGKDPTYDEIECKWLNDLHYLTIHSIASDNSEKVY